MMKQVGVFTKEITELLGLDIKPNTPIFIGTSNITHIINRHEYEYDKYYSYLPDILRNPDYVGVNPKNGSVQYVKEFIVSSEYIRVAVKVTHNRTCFVKTMHLLSTVNAQRYIQKGTLKKG